MDKIKRICIFIHELSNGGVEAVIYRYLLLLKLDNLHIDLVCFNTKSETCYKKFKLLVNNIFFITNKRKSFFKHIRDVKKILKEGNYDVVHSNLFEWNSIIMFYAKKYGVPVRISHTHLIVPFGFLRKLLFKVNSRIIKKCATDLIGCSREACDFLYGINCGEVLSNGFDFDVFEFKEGIRNDTLNKLNIDNKRLVIGNIGRLSEQKNHKLLLEIAKSMKSRNIDATIVCVGCGELGEYLQNEVQINNLEDFFVLAGETESPELFYSSFDVFCFPSLYEGLGISLVEAEVSGLPCIISDKVPQEAIISRMTKILSLSECSPEIWVDEIISLHEKYKDVNRNDLSIFLLENASEFNIKKSVLKLARLYGVEAK